MDKMHVKYRRQHVIVEVRAGVREIVHHIQMPDFRESGFYQNGLSIDAFLRYWLHAAFGSFNNKKNLRVRSELYFYGDSRAAFETDNACTNAIMRNAGIDNYNLYKDCKYVDHQSIWEFYNYINWNYKTKKFN
jgi:hypothetical protein